MKAGREGADAIAAWLEDRVAAGIVPGGTWWVESGGVVVSRGAVGRSGRVGPPEPVSERTPYDLASLTKPLCTALLAVLLEQDGRLSLDGPAGDLVVELAGTRYGGIRLLDFGSHRAGLPAWRPLYLEASSLEGYLWRVAQDDSRAEAVPQESYSDLGYLVLGAAVERAAGEPLDRLFEDRIARPLGLASTGFASTPRRFAAAAPTERGNAYERRLAGEAGAGFRWRTEVIRGEVHDANAHGLGGVAGHAGLFGPAPEVASLARELLRPGPLELGPRARERLLRPCVAGSNRTFGFVLARASEAARGVLPDEAPGHTGFTGTSLWLDPDCRAIYVLLTNRVHPRVGEADFQVERRRFHVLAAGLAAHAGRSR